MCTLESAFVPEGLVKSLTSTDKASRALMRFFFSFVCFRFIWLKVYTPVGIGVRSKTWQSSLRGLGVWQARIVARRYL